MTIFLILGITILILITIVIVQSNKKKEKSTTSPPTTQPPITKPPTTDPPVCTKYKYNSSCLDTCGDKFVDETEKKCYDSVPDGKYADGKTLLDNCGQSETNKIVKGNMCVSSCDEFTYEPQDKTLNLRGECKSTCDNYYIQSVFEKLCLNANLINALFEVDNVKITDDFSKFIIDYVVNPPTNMRVFHQGNNQKQLRGSVVNSPGFIDLKMSSSGTVYARVYKNKIEILIQDLFNQPSTLPKYTINVPQDFSQLNPSLGYEIEEFNFCGQDGVLGTLTQAIIILKSTVPQNGALKKEVYVVIIRDNDFSLFPVRSSLDYYDILLILNVYKPSYLGITFTSSTLREDMFSLCFSNKSQAYIDLVYLQFVISYQNNDIQVYSTKDERIIQNYSYNGTFINAKSTKHIVALLSDKNNTNSYDIDIYNLNDDYKISESSSPNNTPNVVSNIAVGCTITDNTTNPKQSKEIVYYVTREPNSSNLKLFKYKYIKTQSVSTLPDPNTNIIQLANVFPVSSSNANAYLTSNSDGSILAIGIHDGNTKNLYKYNEVSNTVEQLF